VPTTTYDSVDGELIGQTAGGVTTTFLADELGSIVATAQNQALANQYRYTPFGAITARTGGASDPRFLWNGRSGYADLSRHGSRYYVRARHYSDSNAVWTSRDPSWPATAAYGYCDGEPVSVVDPNGRTPIRKKFGLYIAYPCGGFKIQWRFGLLPYNKNLNGWLIQQIEIMECGYHCDGTTISSPCFPYPSWCIPSYYYEAWKVRKGIVQIPGGFWGPDWRDPLPTDHHDEWQNGGGGYCTAGFHWEIGYLQFVKTLPAGFGVGNAHCAWNLPSSYKYAGFKSQGGLGLVFQKWGCCGVCPAAAHPPECPPWTTCTPGPCEKMEIFVYPNGSIPGSKKLAPS